ncbi:MAG: putative integral rane protein [Candidatus Saccharibacteria bacterium]|nr:putative integral rane protein [Candidatus Saccharibacteria bacterium]
MILSVSPYLIAALAAWVVAQGLKYIIASAKSKNLSSNKRQLYLSGGMPSAHSATVVALLVVVGLKDGVSSGLFGLAALFAAIVMYDAVMVRRSSGEQGTAIIALIREQKSGVPLPRAAKGHTPIEVVVGVIIGFIVGIIVYYATLQVN